MIGFGGCRFWVVTNKKSVNTPQKAILVGGFNPFEKYSSKWESSPNWGENDKYLKPPPSIYRYQEWPYFKPEVHLFQAIHPFGALQPLVFGDVCCSGWNLVPFSGDFRSIFRGVNQTIQSINQSIFGIFLGFPPRLENHQASVLLICCGFGLNPM